MISWRLKAAACAAVFISVRVFAATDFFDPASGLRIHHYTDPVPDSVPGGVTLNTAELAVLIKQESVILIDVLSINDVRYDELDGSWPDYPARENIPGSLWLPNVGYGQPADDMQTYFVSSVNAAADGQRDTPIVVYCVSSCWMGWNAVQHLSRAGFMRLYWYPDRTDGWLTAGYPVSPSEPVPVEID